ncbi:LysR substrate-binding domain-containing protein [uncultured Paracoccus sp.]|uniref:LysR substrate-binding domain-containing protein n=1 Tax=Paracoccus sp. S1E-3 TaxID=2756130 RepID=UPI00351A570A
MLTPRFRAFADQYPDVTLEIAAENGFVDIVKQGFDAGIRLGESLDRDMIAVRVSPDLQNGGGRIAGLPFNVPAAGIAPRSAPPSLYRLASGRKRRALSVGVRVGRTRTQRRRQWPAGSR